MRQRRAVIALTIGLTAAAPATGQNELGAGNALDANPAVGTGGINLPAPVPDFRARNLVVTGNVAAGRGFRGTVGYTAAFDFRGELGANDLFPERADSIYSSPSFLSAGRTIEQLRFGQVLGQVEVRRAGRAASPQTLGEQPVAPYQWGQWGQEVDDRLALDKVALSSTTSSLFEAKADAQIVGLLQDREGNRVVASASSLFGVQMAPLQLQGRFIGLTTYDMARTIEDVSEGRGASQVGKPFELTFTDLRADAPRIEARADDGRVEAETASGRIEPVVPGAYTDTLERIAERYAASTPEPAAETFAALDEQFDELRSALERMEEAETAETEPDVPGTGPLTREQIERLAGPLRHGTTMERLAIDQENLGRLQELIAEGEQMLADGEYFRAERRFERALRYMPGHPTATVGMGHAQIGAGLYAPAALTLRRLLSNHPEMIDVTFEPRVLPSRVRLNIAVRRLEELFKFERDRALHAFLLAYLGHQLDRPELVERGLSILGRAAPQDPLLPLLKSIWLEQGP